jgi:hypothetical protein
MPSDFSEKIDELMARVGVGDTVGKVEVDQIYAHYQHEDLALQHVAGGPKYLEGPLLENMHDYVSWLADTCLEEGGAKDGMIRAMEHLSEQVTVRAPVRYGNLRFSSHPSVEDDGVTVYDRPPVAHRLTEEEIKHLYHATVFGH